MNRCKIEGCELSVDSRGWCSKHFTRWRRHGDPEHRMFVPNSGTPRIEDILARSEPITESGCWIWMGSSLQKDGYGMWKWGKHWMAHRVAYIAAYGPIPDDLYVCHTCDVPACVNPDHLWLGTNDDNMADMVSKGRQSRGSEHYSAKLTEDIVRYIRNQNMRPTDVARQYGVSKVAASKALRKKTWRHI